VKKTPIRGKNYLHDFLPVSLDIHILKLKDHFLLPDASPILLFDGTCVLCNVFFQWLVKKDISCKFYFATLQSDYGQQIIKENGYHTNVDSVILVKDGKAYIYSEAALNALVLLGGFYKMMGKLGLLFPRLVRDTVYQFIAKNRYKWFGQKACMIPDHRIRKRFID
jgi:predicted DCC family thiol-disulfide oxidoreductase YuxK